MPHDHRESEPSPSLIDNLSSLRAGIALDLASGTGRNALALARHGHRVECWDRDADALTELRRRAAHEQIEDRIVTRTLDLEHPDFVPPATAFATVLVFRYLWRPLAPTIEALIDAGGTLIYETFIDDPSNVSGPRRAEFLLQPGELYRLFPSLHVRHYREHTIAGARLALLIASRPPARGAR